MTKEISLKVRYFDENTERYSSSAVIKINTNSTTKDLFNSIYQSGFIQPPQFYQTYYLINSQGNKIASTGIDKISETPIKNHDLLEIKLKTNGYFWDIFTQKIMDLNTITIDINNGIQKDKMKKGVFGFALCSNEGCRLFNKEISIFTNKLDSFCFNGCLCCEIAKFNPNGDKGYQCRECLHNLWLSSVGFIGCEFDFISEGKSVLKGKAFEKVIKIEKGIGAPETIGKKECYFRDLNMKIKYD